jgi:CHAT domain-containing protein/tetratricopeptide (TPR) repeat protein
MIRYPRPGPRAAAALFLSILVLFSVASVNVQAVDDAVPGIAEARRQLESGRYDEAQRLARLGLDAAGAEHGEVSVEAAAWMPLLVEVLFRKGLLDEALGAAERNLEIQRELRGNAHPDVAEALNNLAVIIQEQGDFAGARPLLEQSLAMREKFHDPQDDAVAEACINLARLLRDQGDLAGARPLMERGVEIRRKNLGEEHPIVARAMNNLGLLLQVQGDLAGARQLYERALTVEEEHLGPNHPLVAFTLNNLAALFLHQGNSEAARPLMERALALCVQTLGPEHPLTAKSRNNLALLLLDLGETGAARRYMEQSLELTRKARGPDHTDLAVVLNSLAMVLEREGRYEEARRHCMESIRIQEKARGPDHPMVAQPLRNLAMILAMEGDHDEAGRLLDRCLEILEVALGPDHPAYLELLVDRARVWYLADMPAEAWDLSLEAVTRYRRLWDTLFAVSSELDVLRFGRKIQSASDVLLSAALLLPGADVPGRTFSALVPVRTTVLDHLAERRRAALGSDTPQLREAREEYDRMRGRLANAVYAEALTDPGRYRRNVEDANREKERCERRLAGLSAGFGAFLEYRRQRDRTTWQDLAAALPPDTALVSYARFNRLLAPAGSVAPGAKPPARGRPLVSDLAFVVRQGREPRIGLLPLGDAAETDRLVAAYRREVEAPFRHNAAPREQTFRRASLDLQRHIWAPLNPLLEGCRAAMIVPDGPLHLVSFATLALDQATYLVESIDPYLLSTPLDLVRSVDPAGTGIGLLVLADPAFGSPAGPAALPGTAREAAAIEALYRRHREGQASLLLGREASESRLRGEASGKEIIHLATHGFYLADAPDGGVLPRRIDLFGRSEALRLNPLLLSGLLLSGASDPAGGQRRGAGDGLLTAEELATLDLRGTDWLVLSGCGTGTGEIRWGEGVFGLQRAVRLAGARVCVMSLWPVPDDEAQLFMQDLYALHFEGQTTISAMARATRKALLRAREQGGRHGAHPRSWGAFVAVGAWD